MASPCKLCSLGICVKRLFDCLRKLIRAGGLAEAALDAAQFFSGGAGIHALHESGDALEVAVAAACECHIFKDAVLNVENDLGGAGAFGFECCFHAHLPLQIFFDFCYAI